MRPTISLLSFVGRYGIQALISDTNTEATANAKGLEL
jgi:hypothetical protein